MKNRSKNSKTILFTNKMSLTILVFWQYVQNIFLESTKNKKGIVDLRYLFYFYFNFMLNTTTNPVRN